METSNLERIHVIKMSIYYIVSYEVTDRHMHSVQITFQMSHVDTDAYRISYHVCFRAPINFIP